MDYPMYPDCGYCRGPDGDNGPPPYRDPNCPVHGIEAHAAELRKKHLWEIEEVDGGMSGVSDFWRGRRCDAAGGPGWLGPGRAPEPRGDWVFYADGSGLQLTGNCEESAALIQAHFQKRVRDLVAEGFGRELAIEMEVAVSTVNRWVSGVAQPLPRLKKVVIGACRKILEGQRER